MGFLLPKAPGTDSPSDTAVVWRGLMVQKAVQQLLFDVDWRDPGSGAELDALVIDMPPGTGDVPLTLGQLVNVDGQYLVNVILCICNVTARLTLHRCRDSVYTPGRRPDRCPKGRVDVPENLRTGTWQRKRAE